MRHSPDRLPTPDHVQVALESVCASLIVLQSVLARATDVGIDIRSLRAHVVQAIASLHHGIWALRVACEEPASALAAGFVQADGAGGTSRDPA